MNSRRTTNQRLLAQLSRRAEARRIDVPPLTREQVWDLLIAVDDEPDRSHSPTASPTTTPDVIRYGPLKRRCSARR